MKKSLLFLCLCCSGLLTFLPFQASAQANIGKYFTSGFSETFNHGYLKVDFNWNMSGKIQAFVNEGINSLDEERISIAIQNLNQAIELDSTLWMAYYYRGICYQKNFALIKAEQDFRTALSFNASLAEANIELARTYIIQHLFRKADNELEEAIRKKPTLGASYFYKGMMELMQGNMAKARKQFEKANQVDPKLANAYVIRGILEIKDKKNQSEPLALFTAAIEADSSFLPAYLWRAVVNSLNAPQECLKDLNKILQLRPGNTFYTLMRGFLHVELNNFDEAFVDLKNAFKAEEINEDKFSGGQTILDQRIDLKSAANYLIANGYGLDEDAFLSLKKSFCFLLSERNKEALSSVNEAEQKQPSATVYFLKALILEKNNDHPKAFEYYGRALQLDNDIYDAHRKKCIYHFETEDWKMVHTELREMFRLQPASPVGHRLRGMVRFAQKSYGPAIGDFSEFIKTDSTDEEIILMRSVSYVMLAGYKEALKDRLLLAKRHPREWEFHESLVETYLLLKDTAQALTATENFIERNPSHYSPHLKIIEIYVHQKRWAEANQKLEEQEKLIKSLYYIPEQHKVYFWRGMLTLHHKNDPYEAIEHFDKSIKLNPSNPTVRYERARVYESVGQRKRAMADYKELMASGFKDSKVRYESLSSK